MLPSNEYFIKKEKKNRNKLKERMKIVGGGG